MEAKNFRIGNYIYCFGICRIIGIGKNKIKVEREQKDGSNLIEKISLKSLNLQGVNFDKSLLSRLGFILDKDDAGENDWMNLEVGIHKFQSDESCEFGSVFYTLKNRDIKIDYVHHLQNLFFALTGSELQLNADPSD